MTRTGTTRAEGAGRAPLDTERATLDKAAAENFPVAPFFLPRSWRADLMAVYGFARLVDDIGDGDLASGGARRGHGRHRGLPWAGTAHAAFTWGVSVAIAVTSPVLHC